MITLKNITIYADNEIIKNGYISFTDKIEEIGTGNIDYGIDMNGLILIPGFIDQHIHGVAGFDFMDASLDSIKAILANLPKEGTTSVLGTTVTEHKENIINALKIMAQAKGLDYKGAELIGVHLEGPFVASEYKGAQLEEAIINPSIELFDEFNAAADGLIKLVTLAPEKQNALNLIDHLSKLNIVTSIGHSNATHEDCINAFKHGACCYTHTYNAMRPLHHREIGVVGSALLEKNGYVELIADKVHVSEDAIKVLYKARQDDIILVTDSLNAKGTDAKTAIIGPQKVYVVNGEARLENGNLAGSILRMIDGAKNMVDITSCSIQDIIKMTSLNPAKLHRIDHKKGSISLGKDADLLVIDADFNLFETYCKGILSYKKS